MESMAVSSASRPKSRGERRRVCSAASRLRVDVSRLASARGGARPGGGAGRSDAGADAAVAAAASAINRARGDWKRDPAPGVANGVMGRIDPAPATSSSGDIGSVASAESAPPVVVPAAHPLTSPPASAALGVGGTDGAASSVSSGMPATRASRTEANRARASSAVTRLEAAAEPSSTTPSPPPPSTPENAELSMARGAAPPPRRRGSSSPPPPPPPPPPMLLLLNSPSPTRCDRRHRSRACAAVSTAGMNARPKWRASAMAWRGYRGNTGDMGSGGS